MKRLVLIIRRWNYRTITWYGRYPILHKIECRTWRMLYDEGNKWKIFGVIIELIWFKIGHERKNIEIVDLR